MIRSLSPQTATTFSIEFRLSIRTEYTYTCDILSLTFRYGCLPVLVLMTHLELQKIYDYQLTVISELLYLLNQGPGSPEFRLLNL